MCATSNDFTSVSTSYRWYVFYFLFIMLHFFVKGGAGLGLIVVVHLGSVEGNGSLLPGNAIINGMHTTWGIFNILKRVN